MKDVGSDHELFDDANDRYTLQERYLELVREKLPALAKHQVGWPVEEDHCFMRIVLDNLFGGCWYEHLDRRLRAYKQLDNDQLKAAIRIAEQMIEFGPTMADEMNNRSLAWRRAMSTDG